SSASSASQRPVTSSISSRRFLRYHTAVNSTAPIPSPISRNGLDSAPRTRDTSDGSGALERAGGTATGAGAGVSAAEASASAGRSASSAPAALATAPSTLSSVPAPTSSSSGESAGVSSTNSCSDSRSTPAVVAGSDAAGSAPTGW